MKKFWVEKIKCKNPTFMKWAFLFTVAMVWAIWRGCYASTFAYDDGYLSERFSMMLENNGLFSTLIKEFLNLDLASTGEMRFYGLSKALHVIIFLFARYCVGIYQSIICLSQFLSAILLYKILLLLRFEKESIFMAVFLWILSPFAIVQCFHHFTYICLPVYVIMLYTYYNLLTYRKEKLWVSNFLLLFCCIFTGENTIPLLFIIMGLFLLHAIREKEKGIVFKYSFHISYALLLCIGWVVLWKKVIARNVVGRFDHFDLSFSRLNLLLQDFLDYLKYYLFLGEFRAPESIFKDLQFGPILFCLVIAIALLIGVKIVCFSQNTSNLESSKALPENKPCLPTLICLLLYGTLIMFGMTAIYMLLNICLGYRMSWHYFYMIFTVMLVLLILIINSIPKLSIRGTINALFVVIVLTYFVLWNGILIPTYEERNKELIKELEAASKNYPTIVLCGQENSSLFSSPIENGSWNKPKSAFSALWVTDVLAKNYFSQVISTSSETDYSYQDNVISFEGEIAFEGEVYDKLQIETEKVCFLSVDYKKNPVVLGWNDFCINNNLDVWAEGQKEFDDESKAFIFATQLLNLDSGIETKVESSQILCTAIEGTPFLAEVNDKYFSGNLNTSGGSPIHYVFDNLPEENELYLFMDFKDFWSRETGQRIMDICLEVDGEKYYLRGLDLYEIAKNNAVRITIKLPKGIKKFGLVITAGEESKDVAMVQHVGIISK